MKVISSVGPSDSSSYYSGISSSGSSTNTLSGSGLPTQDSIDLQLDSSLLQSLSQSNTSVSDTGDFPTNIQQTVQDQEILATNTNLAQLLSQPDTAPLDTDGSFNGDEYWKDRHGDVQFRGTLSSVGFKSYSNKANYFSYRIVLEQYDKVLERLSLKQNTRFLDAGAGIGIFSQFLYERGFDVTALDVSTVALEQIANANIRKVVGSLTQIDFDAGSFHVVHCFDVLYHIIDDHAWKAALSRLCGCSSRYLILHERFMRIRQLIRARHVKMRTRQETSEALAEHGFFEIMSIPTHLIAMRLPTYRVTQFVPEFFYLLDRHILNFIDGTRLRSLGSHHIKVFERKTA